MCLGNTFAGGGNDVYAIVKYTILCTGETAEQLAHSGGVGFLGFRREDLTRMEVKNSGGLRTPLELSIFPILYFLTDINIKYNENIVGYIISHKNHLNSQIFCANR